MADIELIIDDLVIPFIAGTDNQSYERIGPRALLRKGNGDAVVQARWSKIKTTISGRGWVPVGLAALDFNATHVIKCIQMESIRSLNSSIYLSMPIRTDVAPKGWALMPDGSEILQSSAVISNFLVIAPQTGALQYRADFWPEFSVKIEPIKTGLDILSASYDWQLVGEQV